MNHLYDLDSFENARSLFEQIERDYIMSAKDVPVISNHLEEYFELKENGSSPAISEKWAEISKILDTFDMKVKEQFDNIES